MPRDRRAGLLENTLIVVPYGALQCIVIGAAFEVLHFYCMKYSYLESLCSYSFVGEPGAIS